MKYINSILPANTTILGDCGLLIRRTPIHLLLFPTVLPRMDNGKDTGTVKRLPQNAGMVALTIRVQGP